LLAKTVNDKRGRWYAEAPSSFSRASSLLQWKSTMKKTLLNNPVKALALALGLFSSAVFAADAPLKIGTTAAFAIPLEAAVQEAGSPTAHREAETAKAHRG